MSAETHVGQIKTLTATVHTLVVGSRQVTLSVFGQLDSIRCDVIVPMGRVRLKDGERWMVGSDEDGFLVRAICRELSVWNAITEDEARMYRIVQSWLALPAPPKDYSSDGLLATRRWQSIRLQDRYGREHEFSRSAFRPSEGVLGLGRDEYRLWGEQMADDVARRQKDADHRAHNKRYDDLPLIVLAGFR